MGNRTIQKNVSIDLVKLGISFLVVFHHAPFSGSLANYIAVGSRFAVPFFFMVTGFYNYNADLKTIRRRFLAAARLMVFSNLFYLSWYCIRLLYWNGNVLRYLSGIFTKRNILDFLILNINPLSDHLWYLTALVYCYLLFWLYVRFLQQRFHYRLLYIIGFCILGISLILDGPFSRFITYVPHYLYRNAWFMGTAPFILGILFREVTDRHISVQSTGDLLPWVLILGGLALTFLQSNTIGMAEISLGSYIAAAGLLLFCNIHPTIPLRSRIGQAFLSHMGKYATLIYILHSFLIDLYSEWQAVCIRYLGSAEAYLRPVIVFLCSLITAIVYQCAKETFFSGKKHPSAAK